MKFKLDENLPELVAQVLTDLGYDSSLPARNPCRNLDSSAAKQTFALVAACVKAAVKVAATERTSGQLWVIDEQRVRIRDA